VSTVATALSQVLAPGAPVDKAALHEAILNTVFALELDGELAWRNRVCWRLKDDYPMVAVWRAVDDLVSDRKLLALPGGFYRIAAPQCPVCASAAWTERRIRGGGFVTFLTCDCGEKAL
jgi:hypothetical protein